MGVKDVMKESVEPGGGSVDDQAKPIVATKDPHIPAPKI